MDQRPAEIQRNIEHQRRKVGEKVLDLRERLQGDAGKTKSAWKRQSSRAGQQAKRGLVYTAGAVGLVAVLAAGYSAWRRAARKREERIIPVEVRINQGT